MPTRDRIVSTADQLFYKNGYENTSFADIAQAVQISRGNFYHHFKTKDEILAAVIESRHAATQQMLATWDALAPTPAGRIRCFIHILVANQSKIMLHGCPVGTLATELAKLDHPAQPQANALFTLFRSWLAQQFAALGHASDADELALHLLARSQGIATLANAFRDETFITHEVSLLNDWLAQLTPEPPSR